jgi:predicted ATP-grasp superfamily ATP-dependent carboligase
MAGGGESTAGFVLSMGSYGGTLAAARCLGLRKVPVVMVEGARFAPGSWSRYVTRRERCPPIRPIGRFINWLLKLGARDPGHVLYATCDDLAWAFAERADALRAHFRLLTPPFASVARVLDKQALYAACAALRMPTPRTWFPRDDGDLDTAAREARFPLIVKPRTQVGFVTMSKGIVVDSARELRTAYCAFTRGHRHDPRLLEQHGSLDRPMIQEFHACAGAPIYSVSGFCHPQAGFVARGTRKLVQWPRRAGVGICFEDAPLDATLADRVHRLCAATGIFGVFEAEFVTGTGEALLIDYNPRLFGQVGFDIARGLPSPYFVHLAATGALSTLRAEVEAARRWRPPGAMLFVNRTALAWTAAAQRLVGGPQPFRAPLGGQWRGSSPQVIDAVNDGSDWVPGVVDGVSQIAGALRHLRSTLRAAARGV